MGATEITPEMRQRFERCAPAALRRRSPAYIRTIGLDASQWVYLGAVGLLGLYFWHWPAIDFLLLLLATCLPGSLIDTLRWILAREGLRAQVERHNDDVFVWALAGALRDGDTTVEPGQLLRYRAGVAVLLEWLFLAVALPVYGWILLRDWGALAAYIGASRVLQVALAVAVALPVASGLAKLWTWRHAGEDGTVLEFAAGTRGALLLALAVALLLARESAENFFYVIVFVNGATLLIGLIGVFGRSVLTRDADWLRGYLREAKG